MIEVKTPGKVRSAGMACSYLYRHLVGLALKNKKRKKRRGVGGRLMAENTLTRQINNNHLFHKIIISLKVSFQKHL